MECGQLGETNQGRKATFGVVDCAVVSPFLV